MSKHRIPDLHARFSMWAFFSSSEAPPCARTRNFQRVRLGPILQRTTECTADHGVTRDWHEARTAGGVSMKCRPPTNSVQAVYMGVERREWETTSLHATGLAPHPRRGFDRYYPLRHHGPPVTMAPPSLGPRLPRPDSELYSVPV